MRKWFILLSLLAFASIPASASAQTDLRLSSVAVDIWPEFDQPSVLVIYHIALGEDVSFPASLDLLVPKNASINAVAVSDASGNLITTPYDQKASGEWKLISLQSSSRNIQVEFYDSYQLQGNARQYQFSWESEYPVDAFSLNFQQPLDATDLKLDPSMGTGVQAADGLTYYSADFGSLEPDQVFTLDFTYNKSTDTLSGKQVSTPPVPASPVTEYLTLILGGLGGLLVVGGLVIGFIYWRNGKKTNKSSSRRRHVTVAQNPAVGDIYCSQCGKRAQPGDVFCRTCGTRLQRSE